MSVSVNIHDLQRDVLKSDYPLLTTAPTVTSISGSSAEISSGLSEGRYLIWSDVDCYWRQGATGGTAVTTDRLLPAGTVFSFRVDSSTSSGFVQAITGGASGKLYIQSVS